MHAFDMINMCAQRKL